MNSHARPRFALVALAVAGLLANALAKLAPGQPPVATSSEAELLAEHGVATDAAGITTYLVNLFPTAELQREIDRLVEQLGSDDFADREAATRKLAAIGAAHSALQMAARHTDAEVSYRARRLLAENDQSRESVLLAALRLIQKQKFPGMVPHLLKALPLCQKEHLRRAAFDAILATASSDDSELLRSSIRSDNRDLRTIGILALERVLKEKAVELLRPLLKAEDPATRLAAVEALVNRLPGECLGVLVGLLESQETTLRMRSDRMLRALTGQRIGSIQSAATADARGEIVNQWRRWMEGPGRTAALNLPYSPTAGKLGRVLVCVHQAGGPNGMTPKLLELNEQWQAAELRGGHINAMLPFGCHGAPDGHRLYTDWRTQSIIELDEVGKQVWQKSIPAGPANVERMENGNVLVASYQTQQVAEYDRDGKVVWQIGVGGAASDAHILENGNVLVTLCDQGVVAEFDRSGRSVWKAAALQNPWSARRLPNGNTLVSCSGASRVVEIAPNAQIVRTLDNIPNCADADILENGNLLIGYQNGLREIDPVGRTVREHPIGQVRRLSIY